MCLSWRSAFGRGSKEWLGVEAREDGVAIAQVSFDPAHGPRLHHCEFSRGESAAAVLADLVSRHGLERLPCNWVLDSHQYSLLLLEAPRVADDELREALRWQIKDLITFPVDQAVLDVFELPEDGSRGRRMVYVAAAQRRSIEAVVAASREARLKLRSIDIGELSLRNVAERVSSDARGLALVRLQRGRGNVLLFRQGQLYLSRQFELNYGAGADEALPEEALILEMQRSLDYYERQMAQEAPARILLCGDNISTDKITDSIRQSFSTPLDRLQLAQLIEGAEAFDESTLQLCVAAIGAALRGEGG